MTILRVGTVHHMLDGRVVLEGWEFEGEGVTFPKMGTIICYPDEVTICGYTVADLEALERAARAQ